jgi:hypothetical protein
MAKRTSKGASRNHTLPGQPDTTSCIGWRILPGWIKIRRQPTIGDESSFPANTITPA